MSYVLHLWEHPEPASVAEADRIQTRLSAERSAQNPRFVELARQLTSRYPCITVQDDEDGEVAWSDGPLDGRSDSPVYVLGLQAGMLGEVHPFVVSSANALGLIVYDMQAAEAYLPGGRVLTLPGRTAVNWAPADTADSEELGSKKQVRDLIFDFLKPVMEAHGFKPLKSRDAFKKRSQESEQILSFDLVGPCLYMISLDFQVRPLFSGRLGEIAERYAAWGYVINLVEVADLAGVPRFGDDPFSMGLSTVDSVSGLRSWAAKLSDFLGRALFPFAKKYSTIAELTTVCIAETPGSRCFRPCPAIAILLAFATKNPKFDELAAHWAADAIPGRSRENVDEMIIALQKLDVSR